MANNPPEPAIVERPPEGQVYAVPEESELCLLCLDYLRDLRRSYPPQTLRNVEGLHADYLTVACWALNRAFAAPEQLTAVHGNDPFMEMTTTNNSASMLLDSTDARLVLPPLCAMEDELIAKDNGATEEPDQKRDDEDNLSSYEYDDAHTSNSHRFYKLSGLASGQALRCPLSLGELVAAGLCGLGARSRLDAEREMIQSPMFQQFVQAVKDRGFFDDGDDAVVAGQCKDQIYEQRFQKVAAKFRTKLANKAHAEGAGDWYATAAAEHERQQRALKLQTLTGRVNLPETEPPSDYMLTIADLPTPTSYRVKKQYEPAPGNDGEDECTDTALTCENPIDADEAERYKNQGNSYMQRKEYSLAADCYTKALKISPTGLNSHVYYSNRAAALVSMKMFQEAISDSERSLALKPDYGKAHARLGLTHFLLGNYRQAMEAYTVALKYEPDNKSSKIYLEKSAKRLAETGEAALQSIEPSFSVISEWEKTQKPLSRSDAENAQRSSDEREAEKWKAKGNAYMSSREYDMSVSAYTNAIELSGHGAQSHVYYSNRAAALCYLERYEEAEADSLKSLSINPSYGKAHARLGLSRFFMQDFTGAIEAYNTALHYDPENAASKSYLAKAKAKLEAIQTDQAAKRLAEDHQMRFMASKVMSKPSRDLADDPDMQSLARKAMSDPAIHAIISAQK